MYIVHRREISNALNASVRCEQKRLQRLSETVFPPIIGFCKLSGTKFQPHRKPVDHKSWVGGVLQAHQAKLHRTKCNIFLKTTKNYLTQYSCLRQVTGNNWRLVELTEIFYNRWQTAAILQKYRPICSVAPSMTRLSAMNWPILSSVSVAGAVWISGSGWSTSTSASKCDLWITPSPNVRGMFGFTWAVQHTTPHTPGLQNTTHLSHLHCTALFTLWVYDTPRTPGLQNTTHTCTVQHSSHFWYMTHHTHLGYRTHLRRIRHMWPTSWYNSFWKSLPLSCNSRATLTEMSRLTEWWS